jgi:murein L,D-transpeptidase YafK
LREIDLSDAMKRKGINKFENPWIKIDRRNYKLELYSDKILVKTYKAVFGKNNSIIKTSANDFVTPIGEYQICEIDIHSKYHKFLRINYPNEKDAAEDLKQRYITQDEYIKILDAFNRNDCPPKDTKLGSNIGIHGIGEYLPFTFNWTNGSIAVSN